MSGAATPASGADWACFCIFVLLAIMASVHISWSMDERARREWRDSVRAQAERDAERLRRGGR